MSDRELVGTALTVAILGLQWVGGCGSSAGAPRDATSQRDGLVDAGHDSGVEPQDSGVDPDADLCAQDCYQRLHPSPGNQFKELAVAGPQVAWTEGVYGLGHVYVRDGSQIIQLSDGPVVDWQVRANGSQVVWVRQGGFGANQDTMLLWNGGDPFEISPQPATIQKPVLDQAGSVVWAAGDSVDLDSVEIFLYDGQTTVQLTTNNMMDLRPHVDAGEVVWVGGQAGDRNDHELYRCQGEQIEQVTANGLADDYPAISAGRIVWLRYDGANPMVSDVCLLNGAQEQCLTDGTRHVSSPGIAGDWVVWQECDPDDATGESCEIFLYSISDAIPIQITADDQLDWLPALGAGVVAWRKQADYTSHQTSEIYIYLTGSDRTVRLTNNDSGDFWPQVGGGWLGWIGATIEPLDTVFLAPIQCIETCL